MGGIVSAAAFVCPPSSYDENLSYLEFVTRTGIGTSYTTEYKIPIRYYLKDKDLPTMIVCHGNAEDIGETDPGDLADYFNVNICLFDYAGYGLHSNKQASELSCQEDSIEVYSYLINTKKVKPENIIIYGRSLGTGIAVHLASIFSFYKNKLILVSPLYSAAYTKINFHIPGDIFLNYRLAPNIKSLVLIFHGNQDKIVPYACGQNLAKLFPNLYKFVTLENCDHNDVFTDEYYLEMYNFINLK